MNLVNPEDFSPLDRNYYIRKYGLEDSLPLKSLTEAESERLQDAEHARDLAAALTLNSNKAAVELKHTLLDFLKQPYQDTAEKLLEQIKENLHLMEIIKIKDEHFPNLLTPLPKATEDGILQLFNPFHRSVHAYLSLGDLGIDAKINFPRNNSVPTIRLESYIPEAQSNLLIAYEHPKPRSELSLRKEFAEVLTAKLSASSLY